MLSIDLRPSKLDDVAGQELNKLMLKSILKNPDNSPRVLVFQGMFGCGKTTMARIFARELSRVPMSTNLDNSPYYSEYDSTSVGNVESIKGIIENILPPRNGYKVIVFDEVHSASTQSQNALLKILEKLPERVFIIFATTEVEKVINTIRSRSLEFYFDTVPLDQVRANLVKVAAAEGIAIDSVSVDLIAKKSKGHMRNAHMELSKFKLIGAEAYSETLRSCRPIVLNYLEGMANKDKDTVFKSLNELATFTLVDIERDYSEVVRDLSKAMVGIEVDDQRVVILVQKFGQDIVKLVKFLIADWVIDSFRSDLSLQAAFLSIFQLMGVQQKPTNATSPSNRNARR